MTDRFDNVNLAALPAPAIIEPLDFPTIKAAYIAELKSVLADAGFDWDMDEVEADPGSALAEATGYRELVLRGRINDAVRAVLLAYATGTDLDNLAAFYKVLRMPSESDERLRYRTQIAPEALSVAGPKGAYVFHTLQVDTSIVDVGVASPRPGVVHVIPLVAGGNGQPSDALVSAIQVALNADYVRPLTDAVSVLKPRLVPFSILATIMVPRGPDEASVAAAARASLDAYLSARRRVGKTVYRSGIAAALQVGGVESVAVASPDGDVSVGYDALATPAAPSIQVARL